MSCPRPNCGGLLLTREVVTTEGLVSQTVCHACGRSQGASPARDPYGPPRVRFTDEVEAELAATERSDGPACREYDHSEDILLPPGLRVV